MSEYAADKAKKYQSREGFQSAMILVLAGFFSAWFAFLYSAIAVAGVAVFLYVILKIKTRKISLLTIQLHHDKLESNIVLNVVLDIA